MADFTMFSLFPAAGVVLVALLMRSLFQSLKRKNQRLRAEALAHKYGSTAHLDQSNGRPRFVVGNPQVGALPPLEQEAWKERDEARDEHYLEMDLILPEAFLQSEHMHSEHQILQRGTWIDHHDEPLNEHATMVSEEQIGSGVEVVEEEEEQDVDMDERLEREGGASGEVQISLAWDDFNDLDLHLFCPSGERIYFNNKLSDCGGILDVDMNVRPVSDTPVENVVWKENAPLGTYKVGVHFYKHHRRRRTKRICNYRLRVITHGRTKEYKGKIKYGQAMQMVTSYTLAELTKED
ncbi:MAG: hypothetical protein L7S56_03905 [Candidatus Poseidonia sp.]|nr:hypothetical protein [Poseidonia sp.]